MPNKRNKDQAVVIDLSCTEAVTKSGANRSYLETLLKLLKPEIEALFMRAILVIDGGIRGEIAKRQQEQYLLRKSPPLAQWWIEQMKDRAYRECSLDHAAQLAKIAHNLGMVTTPELAESKNEARQLLLDRSFLTVLGLFEAGQTSNEATMYATEQLVRQGYEAAVVILSNYAQLFTANPHEDPSAQPIRKAQTKHLIELNLHKAKGLQLTPEAVAMLHKISKRNQVKLYFGSGELINARNVKTFLRNEEVRQGSVVDKTTHHLELYQ